MKLYVAPALVALAMAAACAADDGTTATPTADNRGDGGDAGVSDGAVAGDEAGDAAAPKNIVRGGPGCGFAEAAFCDTFDAPASMRGRAGELDARWWSVGRVAPQGPTGHGGVFPIGAAVIPPCRTDIVSPVFVPQDTVVCDANTDIASPHLLTAVASQNYGSNSYRIRQPFDFADRTGTIVFDAAVAPYAGLLGWISLEITEDPISVPSFNTLLNYEGGVIPKNALEIQFDGSCDGTSAHEYVGISAVHVFSNYHDTKSEPPLAGAGTCASYAAGKLNHFEIHVSQSSVEVRITPPSADGKSFEPAVYVYQTNVTLPFTGGYVQLTAHNHATLKYSNELPALVDATVAQWDNVGFDGPIVTTWREYEVPDSMVAMTSFQATNAPLDPYNDGGKAFSTGYLVPEGTPSDTLKLHDVKLDDVTRARLALTTWYLGGGDYGAYTLKVRLNGGAWHDRKLTAEEIALFNGPPGIQGALGQMIDVPLEDLRTGDNTLEIISANVPQNYPPAIANVDLVLDTQGN